MNKQQPTGTINQVPEATKPQEQILKEIKSFHDDLEVEREHRVLTRWRKRKRDEELSSGTAILEKILRTLHEELESRKERTELWDKALVAELQEDRARRELHGRAAVSALSLEKQTKFVHAVASVLSIEMSGEEVGKMLSKTTGSTAPAAEPARSVPPTPPSERRSPVVSHDTRTIQVGTPIKEPGPRRLPVAPRLPGPPSRPASRAGSRDDYTTYSQGLRPQGPGDVSSQSPSFVKNHSADTIVQENQVTNPDRDGRSPRSDAAEQEAENRRPNGLEDKFP